MSDPVFPAFVFDRRSEIEREQGYLLAGQLFIELPGAAGKEPSQLNKRHKRLIVDLISRLKQSAASGQMPANSVLIGWRGGRKPENAVDTDDNVAMAPWLDRCVVIALRIAESLGDEIAVDSDLMRQLGLGPWGWRQ